MRGCSKLLKKATLRHYDAGSLIVEAIYMGEKGSQLIAADVGLNKRRKAQGRDTLDITRTLSEAALPDSIPNKLRETLANLSIPDAFLYTFDSEQCRREYTVVEIKYCRDTKPEDQEARAVAQHKNLISTIKSYDTNAKVKHCTLLLGVGGAIYKECGQTLSNDFGVRERPPETLLRKLHFQSVQAVGDMWKHRRPLLHNELGTKKGRTTGTKRANPNQTPQHRTRKKLKK
jgi:hypothetical protein